MIRGFLILMVTLFALIAAVVGVVGIGMQRVAAAQKEAEANWQPPVRIVSLSPATNPVEQLASAIETADEPLPQVNSIEVWAKDAVLHGNVTLGDTKNIKGGKGRGDPGNDRGDEKRRRRELMAGRVVTTFLTGFHDPEDTAEWSLNLPKGGDYEIDLNYACAPGNEGGHFAIRIGGKKLSLTAEGLRHDYNFRVVTLGKMTLPAGKTTLILCPEGNEGKKQVYMNLRSIQLIPAS